MNLADKFTKTLVRTNADTPRDAKQARSFGAQGIGLCRTEHMFFEGDRIKAVREMILASDEARTPARSCQTSPNAARRFRRHLRGYGRIWRNSASS